MINIEELFASAGLSVGAYGFYKLAVRLYNKYYINSECHNPTDHSTDIIVHISEVEPKEEKDKSHIEVMERAPHSAV